MTNTFIAVVLVASFTFLINHLRVLLHPLHSWYITYGLVTSFYVLTTPFKFLLHRLTFLLILLRPSIFFTFLIHLLFLIHLFTFWLDRSRSSYILLRPCYVHYDLATSFTLPVFRRPWCRNSIQLCQGKGKILVFAGNASHDGLCTCNWKEGWSSSSSQCLDPSGFPANSPCSCEERSCPDGFRLNSC